jgi:superfamily II DNA or RNA helicase/HKD family nuclease
MDITFLGEGEISEVIEELVSDSLEISIASAFMNFKGFSILEKYLKKYDQITSIQILLDENFHPDEQVKKKLLERMLKLPNAEVRIFCDENKLFHSKIYCFKGHKKIEVIVGSSNLTGAGFLHNIELNTLLVADINDSEIIRLNNIYKKYWDKSISAKKFIDRLEGSMIFEDYNIGDKVILINRLDFGIGKIVDIEGNQVDIFFKEKKAAETAHIKDIQLALEPFDMAKKGKFDESITYDIRTSATFLPMSNIRGILSNSIIEILPHQILAAHKVISSVSKRFLLADEVGLGKTFEAGIIIKELISRGEAKRVLIITPSGLIEQWREDMEKFGFDFIIFKTGMETSIKNFWNKMDSVIVSIDTIKIENHLRYVVAAEKWDIIVFDEAHHLTRKDYGQKADKSDRYIVGENLKERAKALLFLTATPHQGDKNKFYNLVNLIDDDLFYDEYDLLQNRNKLNEIMIRQRKIDVTDEKGVPLFVKRLVNALRYSTSEEESQFYKLLNLYLITGYKSAEQDSSKRHIALGFVMTTFQKLAASSIHAVSMALLERLLRLIFIEIEKTRDETVIPELRKEIIKYARYKYESHLSDDQIFATEKLSFEKYVKSENINPFEFFAAPDEINLLKRLLSLKPKSKDTKLLKLIKAIQSMKNENSDEKLIIFTEYLNTQDYIVRELRKLYGEDDVVLIRGGDLQEKIKSAKAFKKHSHFLVSTQAGGEGINLQHCHIVINYDMPWNPMKVEQRIGRVHRYKQKDTVNIYNMFAAGTIEDRIYQRLEAKLREITQTIADEDEREAYRENILGIVAEELNFDELYKVILKKGKEIDEITEDKIDAAVERAKDVYKKLGDFTQDMEKFNLEKYFKTKGKISLKDVEKLILNFVRSEGKKISEDDEGLYEFIIPDSIPTYGGHKYRRITFDREKAVEDPNVEFMAIGHHITNSIISKCTGHGYTGRCVKRQIDNPENIGEAGIQINYFIEYQGSMPNQDGKITLQKDFQTLTFDIYCNYREDLNKLALVESQKKYNETDFSFASLDYIKNAEKTATKKLGKIIEDNVNVLQKKYDNVIYKSILINISLFVIK